MDHGFKSKMKIYKTFGIKKKKNNTRQNLWDLGLGQQSLDMTVKAQFRKGRVDKLDLTKIRNVCSAKDL
jgi:hypothetical protein